MTTEAKLRLVDAHREEFGLNACVQALRLSKSKWHRYVRRRHRPDRNAGLVALITSIIAEHPVYGWRRIQTGLAETHGLIVNCKRLKRVLRERQLGLHRAENLGSVAGCTVVLRCALEFLLQSRPELLDLILRGEPLQRAVKHEYSVRDLVWFDGVLDGILDSVQQTANDRSSASFVDRSTG